MHDWQKYRNELKQLLKAPQFSDRLRAQVLLRAPEIPEAELARLDVFLRDYVQSALMFMDDLETTVEAGPNDAAAALYKQLESSWDHVATDPIRPDSLGCVNNAFLTHGVRRQFVKAGRSSPDEFTSNRDAVTAYVRVLLGDSNCRQLDAKIDAIVGEFSASQTKEVQLKLAPVIFRTEPIAVMPDAFVEGSVFKNAPMSFDSRTIGDLVAPTTDEEVSVRDVWYGTNRAPNDPSSNAAGFSGERDPEGKVHYGRCRVIIPESHEFGEVGNPFWKRWMRLKFQDDHLRLERIDPAESENVFVQRLQEELKSYIAFEPCILLYIHGYNVSFENAAIRAAQMACDLRVRGATAFFSWPSKNQIEDYFSDRESIEASEAQLESFLVLLAKRTGVKTVHIIAHSMGNRGFARAVARITKHASETIDIRFGQIILAAPDVDVDLFRQLAAVYPDICERTTMYVSARDKALGMSQWLQDSDRAGFTPPITIVDRIDTIEVSHVDVSAIGHGYFAEAAPILYDIKELLETSNPPDYRARLKRESRAADGKFYWVFAM
jgi:esterase/lipase superfamily enzyme